MLNYNKKLKSNSRHLRNNSTQAEILLWSRLRCKQLHNIQFYRQKTIGNFIADFFAPAVNMVIELDGSQHYDEAGKKKDKERDSYLNSMGIKVLRFSNLEVMGRIDDVVAVIYRDMELYLENISGS